MYLPLLSVIGIVLVLIVYFTQARKDSEQATKHREEHYEKEISRLQDRIQYLQENKEIVEEKMSIDDFKKTVDFFNRLFDLDAKAENMDVERAVQKLTYKPDSYEYILALTITYSSFFTEFLLKMEIENEQNQKHYYIRDVFEIYPEEIFRYLFCDYFQAEFFPIKRNNLANYKKILLDNVSDFIDYVIEDYTAKRAKESDWFDEDDDE